MILRAMACSGMSIISSHSCVSLFGTLPSGCARHRSVHALFAVPVPLYENAAHPDSRGGPTPPEMRVSVSCAARCGTTDTARHAAISSASRVTLANMNAALLYLFGFFCAGSLVSRSSPPLSTLYHLLYEIGSAGGYSQGHTHRRLGVRSCRSRRDWGA